MDKYLGLPLNASTFGSEIDHAIAIIHWLMLVLFVGWAIFYIYALIRFRKTKNPKADYVGVKNRWVYYLAGAVAVLELTLLFTTDLPLWAKFKNNFPPENESVIVRVVAEQFAWNIHYPGPDGVFGRTDIKLVSSDNPLGLDRNDPFAKDDITTINQLHLPVNKPVILHLSSKDVIHSFNLPVMRVKQDVIPGMSVPVWFVATVPGQYEIACAQLCGLGHYRMRGYLTIDTQSEYDAWLAQEEAALKEESN